jgi:hypothetical protein
MLQVIHTHVRTYIDTFVHTYTTGCYLYVIHGHVERLEIWDDELGEGESRSGEQRFQLSATRLDLHVTCGRAQADCMWALVCVCLYYVCMYVCIYI